MEEVADILDKLPESARTVCAVAAFTGLARSELKGLKWEDYDGETINGRRKIWNDHVGASKTEAREAGVYVVPLLRKILAKYKASYPSVGEGWIFRGEKMLDHSIWTTCPGEIFLNTSTVRGLVGTPFARGLGTRLNEAGVDDNEIQSILRRRRFNHASILYSAESGTGRGGLRKLDKTLRTKYGIKG